MLKPSSRLKLKTLCQFALAGYWLALFVGTHLPPNSPLLPSERANFDKLYHFAAYAVLAGLLATVWQLAAGALTIRHLCWTWVAVVAFGALDELTQIPVNRDCSFSDWTADAIGAAAGLLAFVWLRKAFAARLDEGEE